MSFEKYAVDLNEIPPTDEQLRTIKKLGGELGRAITAKQAEEYIEELEKNA